MMVSQTSYCCNLAGSVVPEHVQILGERELNVLYYCLINVTMNSFILVPVNGTLAYFNFAQYGGYLFINTADAAQNAALFDRLLW